MSAPQPRRVYTVAVVQAAPVAFDVERTLQKLADLAADARDRGARLAVFPEAFVSAYPRGLDFGTVVGARSREGREQFRRYWQSAIEVPGPHVDRMAGLARANGMHLVVGVVERSGGTLYCTAIFLGADGRYLGKHRKLMPTASERLVWGLGDGSTMPVLETPIGRIGAAICWENYMPGLRQAMYGKGIDLWCAPTVDERDIWQASMRHIAYEGRTFVLSACQYLTRADAPEAYDCVQGNDPSTVLIRGGSVIVGPLGDVLAGPVYGREAVITADIDLSDAIRGKYDLDVVGHYARPDIFSLRVNETARRPVACRSDAADEPCAPDTPSPDCPP